MSANADEKIIIDGLAVSLFGPPGAPPVLMSAGLGGAGAYWRSQVAPLSQRQRVILYDHRGTGGSDRAALPSPYSSAHLAEDMARILGHFGPADIVGHAAGGIAGLELALRRPELVRSLCVVNGWATADRHFKRCFEIRLALYQAGGPRAYLRAQPLFLFPAEWISDHLDELDDQAAQHEASFQDEATLRARIAALAGFNITSELGRIACPVLVLASEDDMLVPVRCSRQLAAGLPNARLVLLPTGGHAINITEAAAFERHLFAFLETLGR